MGSRNTSYQMIRFNISNGFGVDLNLNWPSTFYNRKLFKKNQREFHLLSIFLTQLFSYLSFREWFKKRVDQLRNKIQKLLNNNNNI